MHIENIQIKGVFLEQRVSYFVPRMTCQIRLQCIFVCVAQKPSCKTTFQVEFKETKRRSSGQTPLAIITKTASPKKTQFLTPQKYFPYLFVFSLTFVSSNFSVRTLIMEKK